ncbi:Lysophospholipase 1 [Grifola frondosa]|uniref:Lysophospholipase n=1 Tax=Grifola frondosa TaxID=5627 RepID=A0A1C7LMI5_GRIFR|nr:Lysophospholipase 1 [Grifola frondosa]
MEALLLLFLCLLIGPLPALSQTAAAIAYAPTLAPCPSEIDLVRYAGTDNQSLSDGESTYIMERQHKVISAAWESYLDTVTLSTQAHLPEYVHKILLGHYGLALPKLGIATSGGGYRAAIFGAGVLNTLDGRNSSSVAAGTGGLLQAASYLAGLSGGSWLVSSLAQADFPPISDLVFGPPNASVDAFGGWITEINLLQPSNDANVTQAFAVDLTEEVLGKYAAGFPVTVTDVWGRTLSRHFVKGTNAEDFFDSQLAHGAGVTFSSIANVSSFQTHLQPFPIIVSDSVSRHSTTLVPLTNPIYEFNVFEMGSFDPMLSAFTPMKFLGSPNSSICATNFDQLSFIQGTSSNLFNSYNTTDATLQSSPAGPIIDLLEKLAPEPGIELDAALVPNPFIGIAKSTFLDTNETLLTLVDGGEDGEVLPIQPLLVKARGIDIIFATDATSDTDDNFADGSSLIATQNRVSLLSSTYSFPAVPTNQSTFTSENLAKRPTFFGCDAADPSTPLIIYLANGGAPLGQTPVTNVSTSQFSFPAEQVAAMLEQTFDIATQGIPLEASFRGHRGLGKDPHWPACLACAVVDRARRRVKKERVGVCAQCMERYCWS